VSNESEQLEDAALSIRQGEQEQLPSLEVATAHVAALERQLADARHAFVAAEARLGADYQLIADGAPHPRPRPARSSR
jgi:hypothetical protein